MPDDRPPLPVLDFSQIGPSLGERFPDLVLPNQRGERVDLHARRGSRRALVLIYRSASWWPFCKTQLVELQQSKAEFDREGIALFAVSYDSVEVLAGFAEKRGITYDLLSDEGSHSIRALGLLNTQLDEQHAHYGIQTREHHRGVPYPGVFILDERGLVVDKRFEQSYRTRPTAVSLLEEGFGVAGGNPAVSARVDTGEIQVAAWLGSATYRPYQKLRIGFAIGIPAGLHVYGSPTPEGLTPLAVGVDPLEAMGVGPVELPEPHLLVLPGPVVGDQEPTLVYEGTIRGTLPLTILQNIGDVSLGLRIRYQACGETACFPPGEASLSLPLAGLDNLRD